MMYSMTFNAHDDGYVGKAFECALKTLLDRKNADKVSPAGKTDFIYNRHHYEVKQNGGVAQYDMGKKAFSGTPRIIYATHIVNTVTDNGNGTITVTLDLEQTEFFVLDREVFTAYLKSTNSIKVNASRGTMNIQTMYNYKKNAYHGARGKELEKWARKNALQDEILGILFDKIYGED